VVGASYGSAMAKSSSNRPSIASVLLDRVSGRK
jgi:hypothetical protein